MIDGLLLAIQFLTRLPINKQVDFNNENLSKSILFFPLVGIIIGGIGGLTYHIFSYMNKDIGAFCTFYDNSYRRSPLRWII